MYRVTRIIVVIIMIGLFRISPAHAQSPTPISPNPSAPIVRGETVFMDQELFSIQVPVITDFFTPAIWDSAAMGLLAQFSTVSLTADQWKLPNLSDYARRFYGAATSPLTPKALQDRTTHATQEPRRQFSVAGRLCIYKNGSLMRDLLSPEVEIDTQTDNPENAAEFGEGGKFLGAAYVRGKVVPENDTYDYRKPEVAIDRNRPFECAATIATSDTQTDTDTSQGLNRFIIPGLGVLPTIIQTLWRLSPPGAACAVEVTIPGFPDPFQVNCNTYSIVYKGTTLNPWTANTHCNIDGCDEGQLTTVDYRRYDSKFDDDVQTGGLANTFRPQVLSYTNKLHGGDPQQSITSGGQNIESPSSLSFQGSLQDNSRGIMCSLLPKSLQTEECVFASGGCGSGELPDLSTSDGSCTLCNTSDLNGYVSRFGYPRIPDLMIDILNKAGESYDVPASVLLSLMYSEGSLERWQWTEENTREWSICGGEVPNCDGLGSSTGARGPFAFISSPSGDGYDWSSAYQDAVRIVDPTRNEFSPCNFLDSAFAAAKKLHMESGGSGNYPYTDCWGHPIYQTPSGISTSCSWTEERITTGIRQYAGYCTEPGKNSNPGGGTYPPQTADENHFDRAVQFYSRYTCQ